MLEALSEAAAVVLGPGSLYTSVLAAAVVPGLARGHRRRPAPRWSTSATSRPQAHETDGYDVADHVDALRRHGLSPDVVLYDPTAIDGVDGVRGRWCPPTWPARRAVSHDPDLLARALGAAPRALRPGSGPRDWHPAG